MKFYSEILDEYYDSERDCMKAEKEYRSKQEELEKEAKQKELKDKVQAALVSKEKKELAKAIDEAEKQLSQAYTNYDLAKEKVKKILDESNKQCEEILTPAKEAIKEASQKKIEAISNFNKKYGAYTTTYTGTQALDEFKRASNFLDELFNNFF